MTTDVERAREFIAAAYVRANLTCQAADVRAGNKIDWVRENVAIDAVRAALTATDVAGAEHVIVPREPTETMVRMVLTQTDLTVDQLDFGASVIEGMPPLPPHRQRDGIIAAAEVARDWSAMIAAAIRACPVVQGEEG